MYIALMRIVVFALLTVFVHVALTQTLSQPKEFRLFKESGGAVKDYNQQIQNIITHFKTSNEPAWIQFSHGVRFRALGVVSALPQRQNVILDLGENVLRLRKTKYKPFAPWVFYNPFADTSVLIDSLGEYQSGYRSLVDAGVSVPAITLMPGHEREFVLLEKINIKFLMFDYMNEAFVNSLPLDVKERADKEFLKFVSQTAMYRNIGDFHSNQLVYSEERGWVLLDFTSNHEKASSGDDGNVFEFNRRDEIMNRAIMMGGQIREQVQKSGIPAHLRDRALQVIQRERARLLNTEQETAMSCELIF